MKEMDPVDPISNKTKRPIFRNTSSAPHLRLNIENPPINHIPSSSSLSVPQYFNYSLNSNKPTLFIPSLDDIIENSVESSNTPYNKSNLILYLSLIHCLENFEFIIELNNLIKLIQDNEEKHDLNVILINWQIIYKNFLINDSPKEINIPHSVKSMFNYENIPNIPNLKKIKFIVFELLHDSYNEFIKYIKTTNRENGLNYRRRSEIVAPDFAETSFSPTHEKIPRSTIEEDPLATCISLSEDEHIDEVQTPESQQGANSSRNNSATSSNSSRGSSLGSIVENLKNHDYINWKKTVKKFKLRRFLNQNLNLDYLDQQSSNHSPG